MGLALNIAACSLLLTQLEAYRSIGLASLCSQLRNQVAGLVSVLVCGDLPPPPPPFTQGRNLFVMVQVLTEAAYWVGVPWRDAC